MHCLRLTIGQEFTKVEVSGMRCTFVNVFLYIYLHKFLCVLHLDSFWVGILTSRFTLVLSFGYAGLLDGAMHV
jgi:hypothetical protein